MKTLVAILMGLYCAFIARDIAGRLFGSVDGHMSLPMAVNVIVFLVSAPAGTWLVLRKAPSWRRLIFNGCALGAVEWLSAIVAGGIYQHRVRSALLASGVSQQERISSVSNGLDGATAFFCLVVCLVGLLQTRNSSEVRGRDVRRARIAAAPGALGTTLIVAFEGILAALIIVSFIAIRRSDLGLAGILPALVVTVMAGVLVVLAIAGMGQGLRLLKARTHRVVGLIAVTVSAAPILCAGVLIARGAYDLRQLDARVAERREQYRQMEPFFRTPQVLKDSYATTDEIVLVFADDREVRMSTMDGKALADFCDESLVGKALDVRLPSEGQFLANPDANVLYEGTNLQKYWREHRTGG